jgi:hypothetical protein
VAFPGLKQKYDALLYVQKAGLPKAQQTAMAALVKKLAAKRCKYYLRTKKRWIKIKIRSRKLAKPVRKRLKALYKAAKANRPRGCIKRSLNMSPVVKAVLEAQK